MTKAHEYHYHSPPVHMIVSHTMRMRMLSSYACILLVMVGVPAIATPPSTARRLLKAEEEVPTSIQEDVGPAVSSKHNTVGETVAMVSSTIVPADAVPDSKLVDDFGPWVEGAPLRDAVQNFNLQPDDNDDDGDDAASAAAVAHRGVASVAAASAVGEAAAAANTVATKKIGVEAKDEEEAGAVEEEAFGPSKTRAATARGGGGGGGGVGGGGLRDKEVVEVAVSATPQPKVEAADVVAAVAREGGEAGEASEEGAASAADDGDGNIEEAFGPSYTDEPVQTVDYSNANANANANSGSSSSNKTNTTTSVATTTATATTTTRGNGTAPTLAPLPPPSPPPHPAGFKMEVTIGAGVGGLFALLLMFFGGLLLTRRRKKKQQHGYQTILSANFNTDIGTEEEQSAELGDGERGVAGLDGGGRDYFGDTAETGPSGMRFGAL